MSVELQSLGIVVKVEVSIAQLAVDSTEHLQVLRAYLDGGFEKGNACSVVPHLTEPLALQCQL